MERTNDDLWLDHVLAKARWPEPSDDLHARILQHVHGDGFLRSPREHMRWSAYAAAFILGGFLAGSFYASSVSPSFGNADAAYYSDSNFEYSTILGS